MATEKLTVGIAGYGVVGKRRRTFIDLNPCLETIAVSDITFGGEGRLPDGVRYYPSCEGLFRERLDVLFVSLPNYLAARATMEGLRRGMHVFCEKPPGRTVQDIQEVIHVEKQHPGLKLKYGFNHRYHDSVNEAKKIIESGQYGPIINMRGVYGKSSIIPFDTGWRSERRYAGGGLLLDHGKHNLQNKPQIPGEIEEVKSLVYN